VSNQTDSISYGFYDTLNFNFFFAPTQLHVHETLLSWLNLLDPASSEK